MGLYCAFPEHVSDVVTLQTTLLPMGQRVAPQFLLKSGTNARNQSLPTYVAAAWMPCFLHLSGVSMVYGKKCSTCWVSVFFSVKWGCEPQWPLRSLPALNLWTYDLMDFPMDPQGNQILRSKVAVLGKPKNNSFNPWCDLGPSSPYQTREKGQKTPWRSHFGGLTQSPKLIISRFSSVP